MDTKPAQDWDVVWDYMMGFPEDNGFEKVIDTNPQIEMTGDGLQIIPGTGYVRYVPLEFETCNEGIYEETIIYNAFATYNGNRMMLSEGIIGLQIYIYNNSIIFNNAGTQVFVTNALELQKKYTIRIERLNGINRIYLNGDKIYETDAISSSYVQGNRIFFQSGGEYLLKSIKFKKIS